MQVFQKAGQFGYLLYKVALHARHALRDRQRLIFQLDEMGVKSIPLVLLVGFFSGTIIAWQAAYQFKGMITLDVMGGQTSRVIVMEMGPVLTALVISGRLGASITAELGAMKITEQIDALRVMAIDPHRFLVMPRVLGLALMMPVLTLFANFIAIFGAYWVSDYFLGISREVFFDSVKSFFLMKDLAGGLLKSLIFGILISSIGCHMGLSGEGGTAGLGRATIRSFVYCAVSILISDFLLWLVLF